MVGGRRDLRAEEVTERIRVPVPQRFMECEQTIDLIDPRLPPVC